MDGEKILATPERLRTQETRLQELMNNLPAGASVPSEELMTAMAQVDELRNELESLLDDSEPQS
jgi:hypothetical protein